MKNAPAIYYSNDVPTGLMKVVTFWIVESSIDSRLEGLGFPSEVCKVCIGVP